MPTRHRLLVGACQILLSENWGLPPDSKAPFSIKKKILKGEYNLIRSILYLILPENRKGELHLTESVCPRDFLGELEYWGLSVLHLGCNFVNFANFVKFVNFVISVNV